MRSPLVRSNTRTEASTVATRSERPFSPHLRLFAAPVVVDRGAVSGSQFDEITAALASVTFDYAGTRVRASDRRQHFYRSTREGVVEVPRALDAEERSRAHLERFGLHELSCMHGIGEATGRADYVVQLEADVETLTSFGMEAIPALEEQGWAVHVDPSYPCQVADGIWYANAESQDESWFSLELGVMVDDERIDLLPVLLDLIDKPTSSANTFRSWAALPLGGKRYLPVPHERMKNILSTVVELYDRDHHPERGVLLPTSQASMLGELDRQLDIQWRGTTSLVKRGCIQALVGDPANIEPPEGLQATLRPYQVEGVAWMQHLRNHGMGGVLADDMGLGKTIQTIAHLLLEHESGRMSRPSLIVAPTSLLENWRHEISKFAPSLRTIVHHGAHRGERIGDWCVADVIITSYPLVVRDRDELVGRDYHFVILDEAQAIKNPGSQVNAAVNQLRSSFRLCLTGTPIENNLTELWALIDFANPGFLGSRERFRDLYRDPIEKGASEERLEALRKRVEPLILRRMKHRVAKELPGKTELVHYVELEDEQRDLYESIRLSAHEQVRRAVKANGVAGSTIEILDALMKLRQVCCDPRLVRLNSAREVQRSAKYDAFFDMVEPQLANGHRVLVFSQFTSMLDLLEQGLIQRDMRRIKLTGATRHRQRLVDAFQNGFAEVFLISLKAGGCGLTLTRADTVIHYDPWWNPAIQAQATDRAYRIGQTRPVFAYNLVVAGSVEERIMRLQKKKQVLADNILASSHASLSELSVKDIDGLLGPLD
ncbi:MAG: DEAD/DEAH box helicase [Myxococcota bacterium]